MVFNFYVMEREVETFIRINDDLFLELEFLPSRVSSQGISINLMKDLLDFGGKFRIKPAKKFIRISLTLVRDLYLRFVQIS